MGPEGFFLLDGPGRRGSVGDERTMRRTAAAVCPSCPVRDACLVDALQRRERHGVWGGTTPGERSRMAYRARHSGRNLIADRAELAREIGAWSS